MMPLYMSFLSQPKQTILIFVLSLHLSEDLFWIPGFNFDNL